VDRADQYCGCYRFRRRSYKWWKKLFFWLMEVAVVNSYILYSLDKKECGETLQIHLSYRGNLITQLVGNVRNRNSRKRGRPSSSDLEERLNGKMHFIMQNEKNQHRIAWFAPEEMRKGEGEKPFSAVRHAKGSLDFILEIASRSITLKKIINKNKQKHFNYFM
jgi:hypothetical protein